MKPFRYHDFILGCYLSVLLCIATALSVAGCKTSPERASFNATATTITTADAAIKVWFAYVQREEDRLERLKATDRGAWMAGRRALLINEGKVANAWDSYVSATRTLVLAATELQPDKTPDASRVDALRSELISLVTQLTR